MELSFNKSGQYFDKTYGEKSSMISLAPFANSGYKEVKIKNSKKQPIEEYYRQRLIYCLIESREFNKSNFCLEFPIPKGRRMKHHRGDIRTDITVFTSPNWNEYCHRYLNKTDDYDDYNWLEHHMLIDVECKCEPKRKRESTIKDAWGQLKSYLQVSECSRGIYGIICDEGQLYLFKKQGNNYVRLDGSHQLKTPDRNENVPIYQEYLKGTYKFKYPTYNNLEGLTSQDSSKMKNILYSIKETMDSNGLANGNLEFNIIVQIIATRIYDERIYRPKSKRNEKMAFYIKPKELKAPFGSKYCNNFIDRFSKLFNNARNDFNKIISLPEKAFHQSGTVNAIKTIVNDFQDISFIKSAKSESNLYQLIFDEFSPDSNKNKNAEFLTPLAVIKFVVDLVHPRQGETLCDPTVGTADFLSLAFAKSREQDKRPLIPNEIYGMDIDPQIVKLARLNMMLNDDGNSNIYYCNDMLGSIAQKFSDSPDHRYMPLTNVLNKYHDKKNFDWSKVIDDNNKMKKFDVILTNPPFGKQRPFRSNKSAEAKRISSRYELFDKQNSKAIDKGALFLENMIKSLNPNGRYGIVLSSSIASVKSFKYVRHWLINHSRIVGIFDLPPNTFADTAVNTTIIIGYKPSSNNKINILKTNYQVYAETITHTGYQVKGSKRSKVFQPEYCLNKNFEFKTDNHGNRVRNEDFTKVLNNFNHWLKLTNTSKDSNFLRKKFGGIK